MVFTMLKYLSEMDTEEDFLEALSDVPDTIESLSQEILKHMEKGLSRREKKWIIEILTWTVVAQRDLEVAELELAIRKSNSIRFRLEAHFISLARTLSKCGSFLRLSEDYFKTKKWVSLVQESFKTFITNPQFGQSSTFAIDTSEANSIVVTTLLSYL